MEPEISEQLKRNAQSTAFDGERKYMQFVGPISKEPPPAGYKVEWEEQLSSTSCVHTLTEASLNSEVCSEEVHLIIAASSLSLDRKSVV